MAVPDLGTRSSLLVALLFLFIFILLVRRFVRACKKEAVLLWLLWRNGRWGGRLLPVHRLHTVFFVL